MFKVNRHKAILKDFHKIVNNKLVLFNDGDNDIIYTGTNKYSNRILSCIMYEEDEKEYLRYINVLISEDQYCNFLNKTISFRDIINENLSVFIVDYNYNMDEIDSNLVPIDEIPEDFLPLDNSFCPDFIYDSSFNYSLSLLGGIADLHKAEASELSDVSTQFSDFLKSATGFFEDFDLGNKVYIEAFQAGSFKINYKIEIIESNQLNLVGSSKDKINSFLSNYFKYFFNSLPNEDDNVFKSDIVTSESFKELELEFENIYTEQLVRPAEGVEQKLIDLINYSAKQIENIDYNGTFNKLEFKETTTSNISIPIGLIDDSFNEKIHSKVFNVDEYISEPIIRTDDTPLDYSLQVYQFSSISGKGSAYYIDSEGVISKVIVHATGKENYNHTMFTKSMDEGKPYVFKGIGWYSDNNLKKVTCEI